MNKKHAERLERVRDAMVSALEEGKGSMTIWRTEMRALVYAINRLLPEPPK